MNIVPWKAQFPIQFSISQTKISQDISTKEKNFAGIIPGQQHTYTYHSELEYYREYQRSYFAITTRKAGWDCMRHYEILANGCIPYFVDIHDIPSTSMIFLPKKLIEEAMNLEGVTYLHIDHTKFNKVRYYEILKAILEYTKRFLTTKSMAEYILNMVNYSGKGHILFLSNEPRPDYLRESTLIGLKQLFADRVIDFPKIDYLFDSYQNDTSSLYGKGFSYTKILQDLPINRENIGQRIKNKEFDIVIYGSIHRGLLFHDVVREYYLQEKIVYICGEDFHNCEYKGNLSNLFVRELSSQCTNNLQLNSVIQTDSLKDKPLILLADEAEKILFQFYQKHSTEPSDIHEHMSVLMEYAATSNSILEAGVRTGVCSWAFLTGLYSNKKARDFEIDPKENKLTVPFSLVSIDLENRANIALLTQLSISLGIKYTFWKGNDLLYPISETQQSSFDIIFIDTWHVYGQLKRELQKFSSLCNKYIILHDTTVDEWSSESIRSGCDIIKQQKETGFPVIEITSGLWPAIVEFLSSHEEFILEKRLTNNNGLTVLKRVK